MSTIKDVLRIAVIPALALLPDRMSSPQAICLMLAICGQEADFRHRWQVVDVRRPEAKGPARGLWQFERGGGVRGVLNHASSRALALSIAEPRLPGVSADTVWQALSSDDVLAGVFARLLLWTDPLPLPKLGDEEGAWLLYLRTWRPGAWDSGTPAQRVHLRRKWAGYYAQALREVVT